MRLAQSIIQSLHLIQCSCPVGWCVVQHPLDGSRQQLAVFQQNLSTAGTKASSATSRLGALGSQGNTWFGCSNPDLPLAPCLMIQRCKLTFPDRCRAHASVECSKHPMTDGHHYITAGSAQARHKGWQASGAMQNDRFVHTDRRDSLEGVATATGAQESHV